MAKSKKIGEKILTDSILTVNTIIEETRATSTVLTCYVANYNNLQRCIEYELRHINNSHWWKIYFLKTDNLFIVYLNTNKFIKDVIVCLRRRDGEIMESVHAELVEGLHFVVFEERNISNPKNLLLMNGALTLQCMYRARPLENNIVLTRELQEKSTESIHNSDVVGLCNDLKHLYLNSSFSNFKIVADDVEFKVNSLIISLRSKYFAELFKNVPDLVSPCIEIDASPEIVHEVLLYIYSGELRDMESTSMFEVFYIACNWQITSLVEICIDYFKANIMKDNELEVLSQAFQYNDVLSFIEDLPEYLEETWE